MKQEQKSIQEASYISVKEVAQYLGMKTSTVYTWVSEIPHYRIGNLIRFRKDEIDVWMETKRAGAGGHHVKTRKTRRASINVDHIVRSAIDAAKARSYNSSGKSDHVRDLRKEVKNGTV